MGSLPVGQAEGLGLSVMRASLNSGMPRRLREQPNLALNLLQTCLWVAMRVLDWIGLINGSQKDKPKIELRLWFQAQ